MVKPRKSGRFQNTKSNGATLTFACVAVNHSAKSQPLDGLRVDFKQACQVVHLLCEGMGIRAIERLTRLHRDTVLSHSRIGWGTMRPFAG